MARDPEQVYSYDGKLYGKGQTLSSAELDKLKPTERKRDSKEEPAPVNDTPLDTGSVSKTGKVEQHESSETVATTVTEEELEGMSLPELKKMAKDRGVAVKKGGKKPDYVSALAG